MCGTAGVASCNMNNRESKVRGGSGVEGRVVQEVLADMTFGIRP